jgi:ATP-dependent Clp protease protease subunit
MAGDPFGLLLRQRIVFLGGEVEDFGADALVSETGGAEGQGERGLS